MAVTIVEGKDVVREADGGLCSEPYACVSLISDPQTLQVTGAETCPADTQRLASWASRIVPDH